MMDVVTVGEAMMLFIAQQDGALSQVEGFSRATAGVELNVAVGLSRLGPRVALAVRGFALANDVRTNGMVHQSEHRTSRSRP